MATSRAWIILIVFGCLSGTPVIAATAPEMQACRNAAIRAAHAHGVPPRILIAITLVETGTTRNGARGAWPWTVNVAGAGAWFDSRAEALDHARAALQRGQTSFDAGCFQLNYRWHGKAFGSLDEMFDPAASGDYAARFLKSLHDETGDWVRAAGYYHSRTPRHATRYRKKVLETAERLDGDALEPVPVVLRPSVRLAVGRGAIIELADRQSPGPGAVSSGGVALLSFAGPSRPLVGQP